MAVETVMKHKENDHIYLCKYYAGKQKLGTAALSKSTSAALFYWLDLPDFGEFNSQKSGAK